MFITQNGRDFKPFFPQNTYFIPPKAPKQKLFLSFFDKRETDSPLFRKCNTFFTKSCLIAGATFLLRQHSTVKKRPNLLLSLYERAMISNLET